LQIPDFQNRSVESDFGIAQFIKKPDWSEWHPSHRSSHQEPAHESHRIPEQPAHRPAEALVDITLPDPVAQGHDLLVEVRAVSVNPVDTKVRKSAKPEARAVEGAGLGCDRHREGGRPGRDPVQAGRPRLVRRLDRPRRQQQRAAAGRRAHRRPHAGLARLRRRRRAAADRPDGLGMLFDRLQVPTGSKGKGKTLLVIGAAGGVGSILVQLARQLTQSP
jgi:hypothetical protein